MTARDKDQAPRPGWEPIRLPPILPLSMFFFFSNRFGCLGSLLISAAATLVLLWLMGFLHAPAGW